MAAAGSATGTGSGVSGVTDAEWAGETGSRAAYLPPGLRSSGISSGSSGVMSAANVHLYDWDA